MKIIHVAYWPLAKGFYAINLCGLVFSPRTLDEQERRHEYIHSVQQREMLFVFFFLWYAVEWGVRLVIAVVEAAREGRRLRTAFVKAYFNISFEREAYAKQGEDDYPERRRPWAWMRYMAG